MVVKFTVMSLDESIAVELPGVRTVAQMLISRSFIIRKGDLSRWPHLQGIGIPAVRDSFAVDWPKRETQSFPSIRV